MKGLVADWPRIFKIIAIGASIVTGILPLLAQNEVVTLPETQLSNFIQFRLATDRLFAGQIDQHDGGIRKGGKEPRLYFGGEHRHQTLSISTVMSSVPSTVA